MNLGMLVFGIMESGVDPTVDLSAASYDDNHTDSAAPYSVFAGFRINNDGTLDSRAGVTGTSYAFVENWLEYGTASNVDVQITKTGGTGTAVGMTSGSWYNCGSTQEFYITRTTAGTTTWNGTLTFRDAGTLSTLDSATISLTVEAGSA